MRIVFAGTPEPALPSLRRLIESPRHDVVAVLTRPDAASGRRAKPTPSPVARLALEHGIPVLRPERPNSDEFVAELAALAPDCCAVVAYGALLRDGLLAVPARLGQPALLAAARVARRGAGAGRDRRGRRRHRVRRRSRSNRSLDSGPVFGVVTETVRPTDTAGDLLERLSVSGAALLETTLDGIADGSLTAVPQPADGVTVAPEDHRRGGAGAVGAARPRGRSADPRGDAEPGAWTMIGDLRVKLGPVTSTDTPEALAARRDSGRPQRRARRHGVATGAARLIQPPGKKPMARPTGRAAPGWTNGARAQ